MSTLRYHKYIVPQLLRFLDGVSDTYLVDVQINAARYLNVQVDPQETVMEHLMLLEKAAAKKAAEK